MTADAKRTRISGKLIVLPGNDIDTDRIIPARFLKSIVFEGLEEHVFADDRKAAADAGHTHIFDDPGFADASILVVGRNFGCGSSREHAPQALMRWGIRAVVGESFAEIFFGNCVSLGVPCVTCSPAALARITDHAGSSADLDLNELTLAVGDASHAAQMPDGPRKRLLEGRWDSTAELLSAGDAIDRTAAGLPYLNWTSGG